jgi:hypothetical protein
MPVVLPGEVVHTQHKTLKLGPGLQQFTNPEGRISNLVTRAGTLEQNAKGNQFWVEGNSRRVSPRVLSLALFCRLMVRQSMCLRRKSLS